MTHRNHGNEFELNVPVHADPSGAFGQVMELLIEQGFDGLATAIGKADERSDEDPAQ